MRTRPLPPCLKRWFDPRTGKTYLQFRKRGHKTVPLPQPIGSDESDQGPPTSGLIIADCSLSLAASRQLRSSRPA